MIFRLKMFVWSAVCLCASTLISILVMLACSNSEKSPSEPAELSAAEQQKLDEYRAEIEIGRNMAGRLLQFYGTQGDESVVNYVNQVGAYVAKSSEFPDRKIMIQIVNTKMVNAFACPGGYILVTSGALRHAENEAELAGVLAHEIAHVGYRHMFDKLKSMTRDEMDKANEIMEKRDQLPQNVKMRERPKPEDNAIGDVLAKYLSGGSAGLSIVKAAGAGMAVILEQGLGAEKEYEADAHGVRYAVNAGYDADALNQFLCRLKKKNTKGQCLMDINVAEVKGKGDAPKTILDRTHPPVAARIANINRVLASMDAKNITGAIGKKRYTKYRNLIADAKD